MGLQTQSRHNQPRKQYESIRNQLQCLYTDGLLKHVDDEYGGLACLQSPVCQQLALRSCRFLSFLTGIERGFVNASTCRYLCVLPYMYRISVDRALCVDYKHLIIFKSNRVYTVQKRICSHMGMVKSSNE